MPSAFVRLQGCSVGCTWCDTKYSWASPGGREMTLDAVLAEVASTGLENVVVTGGEPLEHPGFVDVVDALKGAGRRIEVETAGTQLQPSAGVDQWNLCLYPARSRHASKDPVRRVVIAALQDRFTLLQFVVAPEAD